MEELLFLITFLRHFISSSFLTTVSFNLLICPKSFIASASRAATFSYKRFEVSWKAFTSFSSSYILFFINVFCFQRLHVYDHAEHSLDYHLLSIACFVLDFCLPDSQIKRVGCLLISKVEFRRSHAVNYVI